MRKIYKALTLVVISVLLASGVSWFLIQPAALGTNTPMIVSAQVDGHPENLTSSISDLLVGSTHQVSVPASFNVTSDTRYLFTGWSDGVTTPSRSFSVPGGGLHLTAMYEMEYLLTVTHNSTEGSVQSVVPQRGGIGTAFVASPYALNGTGSRLETWVPEGTNITLASGGNHYGSGHYFVTLGWNMDGALAKPGNGTVALNDSTSLTWCTACDNEITVRMDGPHLLTPLMLDPTVSGPNGVSIDSGFGTCGMASFCVITNNPSGTPEYYAIIGLGYAVPSGGCALTTGCNLGTVAYGGPTNAGGASGSNAATVIQDAVNALTSGGSINIGPGVYAFASTSLVMPTAVSVSLIGAGAYSDGTHTGTTTFTYSGSSWAIDTSAIAWPSTTAQTTLSNLRVSLSGHTFKGAIGMNYTVPILNNVNVAGNTSAIVANSIGVLFYPASNGPESQSSELFVIGFDTCVYVNQDHVSISHLSTQYCGSYPIHFAGGYNPTIGLLHYYANGAGAQGHKPIAIIWDQTPGCSISSLEVESGTPSVDIIKSGGVSTALTIGNFNWNDSTSLYMTANNPGGISLLNYLGAPAGFASGVTLSVPSSNSYKQNTYAFPVQITITGVGSGITKLGFKDPSGNVKSDITPAGGVLVGYQFILPAGSYVNMTYTGSPTWIVYGMA